MNFYIKLFLTLFLIISIKCLSQHLKVDYEKSDINEVGFKESTQEFRDKVNAAIKKPQRFSLYYADGNSFFKSFPRNQITHNAGDTEENGNKRHNREVYKESELKVYHNKNENGTYGYYAFPNINEEFYGYTENKFARIDYKDETINIDHYLCKLVEVSFDNITTHKVWYTEDLPISAGPFSFNSFPGLVLRVENPMYTITAVKIGNDAKETDIERLNPKLKVYKESDFDKKMKEVREEASKPTREDISL